MTTTLDSTWSHFLKDALKQPFFNELERFVEKEYQSNICYPEKNQIWNAFNTCALENIRVVILGQDPYHGKGQANGLCFSVQEGIKHPPSLINIFKELGKDLGIDYPKSGDLTSWAKQGVLLLNATLTVREAEPGSHQKKGWETFTDIVISLISESKENIVFLLWGSYAKRKTKLINLDKHCVLTSGHPSPLSANRGYWFDNKHFSLCNMYLENNNLKKITWK